MRISYSSLLGLLIALSIFGYPLVGVALAIVDLESRVLSVPFRALMVTLSAVVMIVGNKTRNLAHIDTLLFVFFAAYLARLIWDWQIQAIEGAGHATGFFLAAVAIPSLAATTRAHLIDERKLRHTLIIFGLLFTMSVIAANLLGFAHNPWADQGYELDRLMFEALNPITIGRVSSVLLLASVITLLKSRYRSKWWWIALAGLALGLLSVLLANSRGPILGLLVALIFLSLARPRLVVLIVVVGGGFFALMGIEGGLILNAVSRLESFANMSDGSSETRIFLMLHGWRAFVEHPLLGAFYINPELGMGYYPHNLFIEAGMAMGLFGLVGFAILNFRMLATPLLRARYRDSTVYALAIFLFCTSLFSGSLWGSSEYFLILALALALPKPSVRRERALLATKTELDLDDTHSLSCPRLG